MGVSPNIVVKKCTQAGIGFWLASKIALKLGDKLPSSERGINNAIYAALAEEDPDAAELFRMYYGIMVRTSDHRIEYFDRSKITKSLVKETRLPVSVAEDIAKKVEADIRRLQLRNVSAPLIREMVNAELLSRRLFKAQARYTRLGLPIYDVSQVLKKPGKSLSKFTEVFGDRIMEEYSLTSLLPSDCATAHLNALIHVHGLSHFGLTPYSFLNDLRLFFMHGVRIPGLISTGPAKKASVAVSHAARILSVSKDYVYASVGIDSFNVLVAPFLRTVPKKRWAQIAQDFLYELNEHYLPRKAFTVTLSKEIPGWLGRLGAVGPGGTLSGTYSDYSDEASAFYEIFLEVLERGDNAGNPFRFPFLCLRRDTRGHVALNSSKCFVYPDVLEKPRAGVMQVVSVNIPKILHEARTEEKVYSEIRRAASLAFKVFRVKHIMMMENAHKKNMLPFLTQSFGGREYAQIKDFYYVLSPDFISTAGSISERIVRYLERLVKDERNESGLNIRLGYRETGFLMKRNLAEGVPTEKISLETAEKLQRLFPMGIGYPEKSEKIVLSGELY